MEFQPYNYQQYCINRIISDPAIGLFLRPGLGKTVITLSAVSELRYHRWSIRKALVVAPKRVAEGTWSRESSKWQHLHNLRTVKVLGTTRQRIEALNSPGDVYIINRENIPWLVDYYRQQWPFDMLILDESTSFKNNQSKRFKAIRLVRRFCRKVVLLTGTPSSKGLMDLWAQIYLLDEGQRLGQSISQYRERYFVPDKRNGSQIWSYKPKSDAEEAVLGAISDICISMRAEDYLELPECINHEIPVVLDNKTKKAYDTFERELLLAMDDSIITAASAGVLTNKLLQFCSGAIYDENHKVVHLHDHKLDAYVDLLEQIHGEPCITFYGFRHDCDRILARIEGMGLRVRVLSGPADEDDWNAGRIDVLLMHPSSGAYGLNLQAGGRHIIWYTPNWSYELNDQGRCRLWRQGTTYDAIYNHFLIVQGGVDEDVLKVLSTRQATHDAVMRVLKARIERLGARE